MMPLKFAEKTKIEVRETIADVQRLLARYNGDRFQHFPRNSSGHAAFQFHYAGLTISFGFPVPLAGTEEQKRRRIYRAAHLAIKAKLESVASGIESPAQAFYAHIVVGNGVTMYEKTKGMMSNHAEDPRR
jgi:hypothetical protein